MNTVESAVARLDGPPVEPEERIRLLNSLSDAVSRHEKDISNALFQDLGKSAFESFTTEISIVQNDIAFLKKHLRKWARPKRVPCSILNWPSTGYLYPEPYGKALIFSAWNYPFQLMLSPFAGAVSAGCRTLLKPAEQAPATAQIIQELISEVFPEDIAKVVCGGIETAQELLKQKFDIFFYTGGQTGGRAVAKAAAEQLSPVILELGGKSPCIVDADADPDLSARRIVWGKFLNAGQTCVAPDYLLLHQDIRETFLEKMQECIHRFYGDNPLESKDYPRIINDTHFQRLLRLAGSRVLPEQYCRTERYIAPLVIPDVKADDPLMQEEIFGPIFPVLTVSSMDEAITFVKQRPKPLALYFYGRKNA